MTVRDAGDHFRSHPALDATVPPPHVFVHEDQAVQEPHKQFTAGNELLMVEFEIKH